MLVLTPTAAEAVDHMLQNPDLPEGSRLRIGRRTDRDESPIGIMIVSDPEPDDQVVPSPAEGDLLLAAEIVDALDDRVLDAEIDGETISFMLEWRSDDDPYDDYDDAYDPYDDSPSD